MLTDDEKTTSTDDNYIIVDKPSAEQYDFIVIGAGTAGAIVTHKIAYAQPGARILLVEAGRGVSSEDPMIWDPKNWSLLRTRTDLSWGYFSAPQPGMDGRRIDITRARALGGCSLHNGMVYVRGGQIGFDRWEQQGATGWNYRTVSPYFSEIERTFHLKFADPDIFTQDLIRACVNNGIPHNRDYNRNVDQAGVSPFQFLIDQQHRRQTTYHTLLEPLGNTPRSKWLPNVTILPDAMVQRVTFEDKRATGIDYWDSKGIVQHIAATREVVLCAGAIGSPQLLLLSGIGDRQHLESLNIEVVHELPGVGQNLQDDLYVTVGVKTSRQLPEQPYGLMGAVIFAHSPGHSYEKPTDIECSLASSEMVGIPLPPEQKPAFFIYPNIQLLKGRGEISLRSSDVRVAPNINPHFLEEDEDVRRCVESIKLARRIAKDPALSRWYVEEITPGDDVRTDEEIAAHVRRTAGTTSHFAGTCKMGQDALAVVDHETLSVIGVTGLRVIDASIIPTTVSGNTAAATMMLAARGADMIIAAQPSAEQAEQQTTTVETQLPTASVGFNRNSLFAAVAAEVVEHELMNAQSLTTQVETSTVEQIQQNAGMG